MHVVGMFGVFEHCAIVYTCVLDMCNSTKQRPKGASILSGNPISSQVWLQFMVVPQFKVWDPPKDMARTMATN